MIKQVICFGGSWCGPCKVYHPIFHKVSEMQEFNNIKFTDVDVDDNDDLVEKYKIMSVPTTIVLDEIGKVMHRQQGVMMESNLISLLNKLSENEKAG